MKKIAVIGAGAAGLMAAYQAAYEGAEVYLFERNLSPGRKILISGKGRCNLTNIKGFHEFVDNIPGNNKFVYSALTKFTNTDLIKFINSFGLETKIERGGRVFPISDKSLDVIDVFKMALKVTKVQQIYNARVKSLIIQNKTVRGIKFYNNNQKDFYCDRVIIATGGLSYPTTGATGDGYKLALEANHNLKEPKPSLVPLTVKEYWVSELKGLSLKNVLVTSYIKHKKLNSGFGEMLFTHYGLSGPVILTLSREIVNHYKNSEITVSIDLKPALSEEELDRRLIKDFSIYNRKLYKNSLNDLLPKKLIPIFVIYSGVNPKKPTNQITKKERYKIINKLKNFDFTVKGFKNNLAIVTQGGVSTKEINPKTMESKLIKGLFFAGEVIDIDGYTGGYNLQMAFSTGYVAGKAAATK